MNEKKFFTFMFVCVLLFGSCCTRNGIHNHGNGAYPVRENLGKLGDEQAQSAVTSTELKNEIDRSLNEVGSLEKSITDGARDLEEFKTILQRIRERSKYGAGSKNNTD